jgi:DNA (cytosine-5)-methyltransferase 1
MTRSGTAYQLPNLERRIDATGSGLWPTPTSNDALNAGYQKGHGDRIYPTLPGAVGSAPIPLGKIRGGFWPTPRAEHDSGRHRGQPDTRHSAVKTWPTPSSRDWKDTPGMAQDAYDKHGKFRNRIDQLARMTYAIERASSPPTPDSGASGSLNPTFVEWLMGYPLGWTALKAWGTRSSRKSPSGSAGRSSPPKD